MGDEKSRLSCPIWGVPAVLEAGSIGDSAKINSVRAGGQYGISGTAAAIVANLSDQERAKLTTWLVEQRRRGVAMPVVDSTIVEDIKNRRALRFSERKTRFFLFANYFGFGPGVEFPISQSENNSAGFPRLQHVASWIEAANLKEARGILQSLEEEGYININNGVLTMTSKGLDKMEEVETGGGDTRQAFVAMWFSEELREAWRVGFAPAIRDAGYDPFRIDGLQHNGKIDDAIVAEIRKSRFLVADFTCGGIETDSGFQPNPRGGVYYEAGLAHGLGMEVIFTCREDRMPWLHFDTRQFAHIVWQNPDDLRLQLYNRIAATLKEAPGAPGRGKGDTDPIAGAEER
jgi:hypothetical protein